MIVSITINLGLFDQWVLDRSSNIAKPSTPSSGNSYMRSAKSTKFVIYQQFKKHFFGWTLVGHEPDALFFSLDGPTNYIGPATTKVKPYTPDLTLEEGAELASQVLSRIQRRRRTDIGVVAPTGSEKRKVVIALRTADNMTIFVPGEMAPQRFAWLANDK